jgi:hypothetical protein
MNVTGDRTFGRVFLGVLCVYLLQIAYSVHVSLWMADESAYHFFGLLLGENFALLPERIAALSFYRGPFWLVDRAMGIHGFEVLRIVYGISLYAAWPLALLLCYGICRRHDRLLILFPVLSCALGSMNLGLFSASESHFMHALFWVLAFAILVPGGGGARRIGTLVGLVAFALSYGGTAVLGAWLVLAALMRMRREAGGRAFPLAAASLAAVSVGIGIWATAEQSVFVGSLGEGYVMALTGYPRHLNLPVSAGALLVLCALAVRPTRRGGRVAGVALVAAAGYLAVRQYLEPGSVQPDVHGYFVRSLNVLVPTVLFFGMVLFLRGGRVRIALRAVRVPVLLLWLGQTLFLAGQADQFRRYTGFLTELTRGREGIILVDTPLFMEKVRYGPEDGYVLHRETVDDVPVHAFTSMWIAVPAHTLLYSERGEVRTAIFPSHRPPPLYELLLDPDCRRKLAARGLDVRIPPLVIMAPR